MIYFIKQTYQHCIAFYTSAVHELVYSIFKQDFMGFETEWQIRVKSPFAFYPYPLFSRVFTKTKSFCELPQKGCG